MDIDILLAKRPKHISKYDVEICRTQSKEAQYIEIYEPFESKKMPVTTNIYCSNKKLALVCSTTIVWSF